HRLVTGALFPFCSHLDGVEGANGSLEMFPRQVGVAQGHPDVFMPQEGLDGLEADAIHDQVTGKGMSEVMKAKVFDPCSTTGGLERAFDFIKTLARIPTKDVLGMQIPRQLP